MTKKIEAIFQHFSGDEKDFVERMIGLCQQAEETYSYVLTNFLNPREEEILQSIAGYFHLNMHSSRQLLATEFVRVILSPDYYTLVEDDFEMMALEICYPRKFHQLTHAQVLGTLLNQLGIRREFIGDILVGDEQTFVILERRFGELATSTVSKISRVPVIWKEYSLSKLPIKVNQDFKNHSILVSSLRLDKIVATGFKLSRSSALKLIESGINLFILFPESSPKVLGAVIQRIAFAEIQLAINLIVVPERIALHKDGTECILRLLRSPDIVIAAIAPNGLTCRERNVLIGLIRRFGRNLFESLCRKRHKSNPN